MKDNSMAKLGGICSILVGILYLVVAVNYFLLPAGQQAGASSSQFFASVAESSTGLVIQSWVLALGALLAIAAVMAISDLVRSANEGLIRWTSTLAIIGFAVQAVQSLMIQDHTPRLAAGYVQADPSAQAALEVMGPRGLDPELWMVLGAVGLWVLVVNRLALRGGQLPTGLAYVGMALGIAYALAVAGVVLQFPILSAITAGLAGIILAPIWYIWTGLVLRRMSTEAS
ncbi:MAG: DUF4386 family protein [Anaerolineales bacterium]|nr:DUF4386 family protein [Anaerolineales bacterium]